MDTSSHEIDFGMILDLDELATCLREISYDQHQWTVRLRKDLHDSGSSASCVEIWYTNPGLAEMLNAVCFRFPSIREESFWQSNILVCLHPSLATQAVNGLYFEDDKLKYDVLQDFYRFWTPLKNDLYARIAEWTKQQNNIADDTLNY